MITHIIWDYNGTILDDVNTSVAAVNKMLEVRSLPPTTVEVYKDTLSLPLDNYYKSIGLKNPDIKKLSIEFQGWCDYYSNLSSIFEGFEQAIKVAQSLNIKNILMSSLYEKFLINEVKKHNIEDKFDFIIGMKDTSVGSKLNNATDFVSKLNLNCENVLFIGDLTSDSDIAKQLGAKCILVPNGHNSKKRCAVQGVTVLENLFEVSEYIKSL